MVVGIQDVDPPLGIHDQGPGLVQFAGPPSLDAPGCQEFAVAREFLDAMVAELGHVHIIAVQPQIVRITKFSRLRTLLAPDRQQPGFAACCVKNLNSIVTGVGDPEVILFVKGQVLGPSELAPFVSMPAPLEQEFSLAARTSEFDRTRRIPKRSNCLANPARNRSPA